MKRMKTIIRFTHLAVILMVFFSCNNDFLDKNNTSYYSSGDTIFLNNQQQNVNLEYTLNSIANKSYMIVYQPKWITFSSMEGKITDGTVKLSFSINPENSPIASMGEYPTTIVLDVESLGIITIPVVYSNFGNPTMVCSPTSLTFESLTPKTFTITNTTNGVLYWQIANIPEWLKLSAISGTLTYGQSKTITVNWSPTLPAPTEDKIVTLQIQNNSTNNNNQAIAVSFKATNIAMNESFKIPGTVADVEYHKTSGIMAICTKSPNSLIIYNTTTSQSTTLPLTKIPVCVSISENGLNAAIGYSVASVSYVNLSTATIIKDYDIDCLPYDIVLGDNSWCYITPMVDQWVELRSLNLSSGVSTKGKFHGIYEKTMIKKIPGKPNLVGTRMPISPSGLHIFNISKGIVSDSVSYWHESLSSFWISDDGEKLFSGFRKVYQLPAYDGLYNHSYSSPGTLGIIQTNLNTLTAVDHCTKNNSVFTVSNEYNYLGAKSSKIEQFDLSNLNKIKVFEASPTLSLENGIYNYYPTAASYIFTDINGTTLFIIKNISPEYNITNWSMEKIKL
jgi:hypothetical protein